MKFNGIYPLLLCVGFLQIVQNPQTSTPSSAQTPSTSEAQKQLELRLLTRIKELYGSAAPKYITWARSDVPMRESTETTTRPLLFLYGSSSSKYVSFKGDVASGVVVNLDDKQIELYLDIKPCNGVLVEFHSPFVKSVVGKIRCGDKEHDRVTVEQR